MNQSESFTDTGCSEVDSSRDEMDTPLAPPQLWTALIVVAVFLSLSQVMILTSLVPKLNHFFVALAEPEAGLPVG